MISVLRMEGFRCFERFELTRLGRLNLLVGTNNSGKTSVLEAIQLLASAGDPALLWQVLARRGERLYVPQVASDLPGRRYQTELDIGHLFFGHEVYPGASFRVTAENGQSQPSVLFSVAESSPEQSELFTPDKVESLVPRLALQISGTSPQADITLPISRLGGVPSDVLPYPRLMQRRRASESVPSQFVPPESFSVEELVALWDKVALSPDEGLVLHALQFLDPDVERIAALAAGRTLPSQPARGGFIVKRRHVDNPIPIGSLGDGMWRMLALAVAITQCRGGVLLVDEIDTGLHYTVMTDMWRLVFNAARDFDVQVFATTHSYDCIRSLAVLAADADARNPITIQRIEAGRSRAVPYNESEIAVAAEKEIEVR